VVKVLNVDYYWLAIIVVIIIVLKLLWALWYTIIVIIVLLVLCIVSIVCWWCIIDDIHCIVWWWYCGVCDLLVLVCIEIIWPEHIVLCGGWYCCISVILKTLKLRHLKGRCQRSLCWGYWDMINLREGEIDCIVGRPVLCFLLLLWPVMVREIPFCVVLLDDQRDLREKCVLWPFWGESILGGDVMNTIIWEMMRRYYICWSWKLVSAS